MKSVMSAGGGVPLYYLFGFARYNNREIISNTQRGQRPMKTAYQEPDISVSDAVTGVTFRHYRGESDIAPMLAVHEGCRRVDQVDPFSVCYRSPELAYDDFANL